MKKLIITAAAVLTIGLSAVFASSKDGISENAMAAFRSDFSTAKNVSWRQERSYFKASFSFNNKMLVAFYNYRGDLVAVIHHILTTDLPENLKESLKENYSNYWITDLFEMNADDQVTYYVNVENSNGAQVLKSDGNGGWELYKRIK